MRFKCLGCEDDHSPQFITEVTKVCIYTSISTRLRGMVLNYTQDTSSLYGT